MAAPLARIPPEILFEVEELSPDSVIVQILKSVLSPLTSSVTDQDWFISFFFALKIISKDLYLKLIQPPKDDELLKKLVIQVDGSIFQDSEKFKVWNSIEDVVCQLQFNFKCLTSMASDALLILLASHIKDTHLPTLANCLQSSTPTHDEMNSLQMLWAWRQKESTNATCLTLIQALLKGGFPTAIAELIIRYVKSEHVDVEVRHRPHSSKYSELGTNIQKSSRTANEEIRLHFAQAYIRVMMEIENVNKTGSISKILGINGDNKYLFGYVLERCNWINFSLLEKLAKESDVDLFVMQEYVQHVHDYFQKLNDLKIPPESVSDLSRAFLSTCAKLRLYLHKSFEINLLTIKSEIAGRLNMPEHHVLISGVERNSIEFVIDKQVWNPKWCQQSSLMTWNLEENVFILEICNEESVSVSELSQSSGLVDFDYAHSIDAVSSDQSVHVTGMMDSREYDHETELNDVVEDIHIVTDLDVQFRQIPLTITLQEFRRIILNHKVPVALCLVAAMGLPHSGKTTILEEILKMNIKLKDRTKCATIDPYLERKRNSKGLSIYELCVLGGPPHNQYAWSFATRRYGAIFSILCGLMRHESLASVAIEAFDLQSEETNDNLVGKHFVWLMDKTAKHFEGIKKKADLQNGLSLVNVMDVGVNKALYDFLPILLYFCRKHVQLAFFNLERDGPNLDSPPELGSLYEDRSDSALVMRHRSRLTYLLHFATIGYKPDKREEQSSKTLMVATAASKINAFAQLDEVKHKILKKAKFYEVEKFLNHEEWICVDSNDKESLKKSREIVQELIRRTQQYQDDLPLRWIFLRSLTVSLDKTGNLTTMIVHRDSIVEVAKELEMDEKEVDEFLTTFTDFGSILYMPQFTALRNIVIVDIWAFTEHLNKLFYPDENAQYANGLLKYGLITQASAEKILLNNEEDFMQIITTLGMVAQIESNQIIFPSDKEVFHGKCYYLPSARIAAKHDPVSKDKNFAFLKIEGVHFPANVQACVSHEVMKNSKVFFLPTEQHNVTQFEFRYSAECHVKVTMIYQGSSTRLQVDLDPVDDDSSHLTNDTAVEACSSVLIACHNSFQRKTNLIRNLKYYVVIPCCVADSHHVIYPDTSEICDACLKDSQKNMLRQCWIQAANKCKDVKEIFQVVQEIGDDFDLGALAGALKFTKLDVKSIQKDGYEGTYLAMMMIMTWTKRIPKEKATKEKATKENLARVLKPYFSKIAKNLMCSKEKKEDNLQFQEQEPEQQVTTESSEIHKHTCSQLISTGDIPKLSVVLQPVETDWYRLGQSLGVEEFRLNKMKGIGDSADDEQMKRLLEIWLERDRAMAHLENALKEIGRDHILSSLRDMKSLPAADDEQSTDVHDLLSTGQTPSVADKCVQFDYLIPSMDNLNGLSKVHIAGKKLFLVQGEGAQLIDWEEYGLRIGVSEGTLSSSETAEVAVVALVGGQFLFPDNTKLASAVYAVSISRLLLKPLRLEVQHCVELTSPAQTKHLKFAIAPINTPSLPYKFSLVVGGEFSIENQYGSINRNKFCLVSVVTEDGPPSGGSQQEGEDQSNGESEGHGDDEEDHSNFSNGDVQQEKEDQPNEENQPLNKEEVSGNDEDDSVKAEGTAKSAVGTVEECSTKTVVPEELSSSIEESCKIKQSSTHVPLPYMYAGLVYYEQRGMEDLVTFTAAKELNALLQYINQKHSRAEMDQNVYFRFKPSNDCIELILDSPQEEPFTGWTIHPRIKPCKLYQDAIDNFGTASYPLPPKCLISVYGSPAPDTVPILNYAVPLEGVIRPVTLFIRRTLKTTAGLSPKAGEVNNAPPASNPAAVFRKNTSKLSNALGMSTNFDRVIDDFFSEELIPHSLANNVKATTNPCYERGSKVINDLYGRIHTSKTPGDLLISICDILVSQEDMQLRELGDSIKQLVFPS